MKVLPFAPRDTVKAARGRRSARRRARLDPAYLAWLHQFPCLVCGRWPVEAHHEPPKSQVFDWADDRTVPLCGEHHRGPHGREGLGLDGFELRYNVSLRGYIAGLQSRYKEENPGWTPYGS